MGKHVDNKIKPITPETKSLIAEGIAEGIKAR